MLLFTAILIFSSYLVDTEAQECSNTNPCRLLTGGDMLIEPPVLRSENGHLEVVLTVEIATFTFGWLTTKRRSYNGSIPGPTWIVKPGDSVNLTIINTLSPMGNSKRTHDYFEYPNTTNIHTHGLHISSKAPQDNVFIDIFPGENYTYHYKIVEDHPAGTFWYHAHKKGAQTFQLFSGLSGILIVEDPTSGIFAMPQHLADISCPDNCQHDLPLIIQPTLQYADKTGLGQGFALIQKKIGDDEAFRLLEMTNEDVALEKWLTNVTNEFDYQTVNGQVFPTIGIETGQRKRFRLINAGGTNVFNLMITDRNGRTQTDNCEVWEIAYDGMYLNSVRKPKLGKSFISTGARVDWIVVCNNPGDYELRSVEDPLDTCSLGFFEVYNNLLATIQVSGLPAKETVQDTTTLPPRPSYAQDFRNTPESEIFKDRFTVEASFFSYINRRRFSTPDNFMFKLPLGKVQEWHLTNTDFDDGHPMHIHVNHFQVISYNEYTGPVSSLTFDMKTTVLHNFQGDVCQYRFPDYTGDPGVFEGGNMTDGSKPCIPRGNYVNHKSFSAQGGPGTIGYVEPGEFRDTIVVPPLSNITIRFFTDRFNGTVLVHCHVTVHSDRGMEMVVEIVNEGEDMSVNERPFQKEIGKCTADDGPGGAGNSLKINILLVFVAVLTSLMI